MDSETDWHLCMRERAAFGSRSSRTLIFTWWHLNQLHVKVQAKNNLLQLPFTCQNHVTFAYPPPSVIWCELLLEGLGLGWSSLKLKLSLKVLLKFVWQQHCLHLRQQFFSKENLSNKWFLEGRCRKDTTEAVATPFIMDKCFVRWERSADTSGLLVAHKDKQPL